MLATSFKPNEENRTVDIALLTSWSSISSLELLDDSLVKIWTDLLEVWDLLIFFIQGNPYSHNSSSYHLKNLISSHKSSLNQSLAIEEVRI